MVHLPALWLPILLSAVAVFFASSIIWMALPIHKNDYGRLGDKENAVMAAVRSWGLRPGLYMFPYAKPNDAKTDAAVKQKIEQGPWGTITVQAQGWTMGKTLGLWMLNLLVISTIVGYIVGHGVAPGATFMRVFQMAGATALLGYGGSILTNSIWKNRPWSTLPGSVFDAVVYALVSGAIFGALWPKIA